MATEHDAISSTFQVGDRVRVNNKRYPSFWANGALGTVVRHLSPEDPSRIFRMVPTVRGPEPYYWVELDEPRIDGDGDGPYESAEFAASWLESIGNEA